MWLIRLMLFRKPQKTRYRFITIKLLVAVSMVLQSGCTESNATTTVPALVDRSFITGKPCAAPCWYGLEMDKSTKADVIATLDQLPFVEHGAYRELDAVWMGDASAREVQILCADSPEIVCGGALISQDLLKQIWLNVRYELPFSEAVNRLGTPDIVEYGYNESAGCQITLYWSKRGIGLKYNNYNSYSVCQQIVDGKGVPADTLVQTAYYFATEGLGQLGKCCQRVTWPGFAKP